MRSAQSLLLALALAGVAAGQQQMVRLNVAAFDSRGQAVGDLTKADFQLQEGGKEQALTYFHAANRTPGVFSHATIVLFDLLNADITNRGFATDELVHALQNRETSDFLYFYLLTPDIKLMPVHALPDSMADIHAGEAPWTKDIRATLDAALKSAAKLRSSGLNQDELNRRTYEALATVVRTVAMVPGRKNIVWISRGMPISLRVASGGDAIDYKPFLRKLADACLRANVTVHTANPSTSAVPSEGDLTNVETLQTLASLTGGRLFTANSIGRAVTQAADEWRGDYTIGFAPSADSWDGKLHKLKLAAARRGIDLMFPEMYYATRPDAPAAMRESLQAAISTPFDSPEMRVRVTAKKGKTAGSAQLDIHVDYNDAVITEKGGRFNTDFVLTIVDYTAKGPKAIATPASMNVSMTDEQRTAAMKDGIPLTQDRTVGDGIERMRVILYDPATNLTGSATVAVGKLE